KNNLGELDVPPSKEDIESARWIIEEQVKIIKPQRTHLCAETCLRRNASCKQALRCAGTKETRRTQRKKILCDFCETLGALCG
ncbi:MAG: hypothetical protein Q7U68_05615, partial [Candidatus Roizmanbacteria bacterium]|nr:hypothetical protein [Candidatus Roizmanbacteria bacterium]